jgi:Fic family protein
LVWFAETVLESGRVTQAWVSFLVAKAKLFERLRDDLNSRQEKVLVRMFREGPEGFKGGLSAQNYATITCASPATITRDLQALVDLGALTRTGERRHTRYWLKLEA